MIRVSNNSLVVVLLSALALGSAACYDPSTSSPPAPAVQGATNDDGKDPTAGDWNGDGTVDGTDVITTAPAAPVPVTCVLPSPHGTASDVTEGQCIKLLSIAG